MKYLTYLILVAAFLAFAACDSSAPKNPHKDMPSAQCVSCHGP